MLNLSFETTKPVQTLSKDVHVANSWKWTANIWKVSQHIHMNMQFKSVSFYQKNVYIFILAFNGYCYLKQACMNGIRLQRGFNSLNFIWFIPTTNKITAVTLLTAC